MSSFIITVGSYETPIYGFQGDIRKKGEDDYALSMRELFAHSSHLGCIKAVAASGKWLASSSTDETVKVYDARRRTEFGTMMQGEGLANCLEFFGKTHLFVGLENGNIVIYDTNEWESQKTMKGHTGRINSIAVHPSGLLALSTSKDRTMRLWALKKGVCSHTEKLGFEADKVIWSPKGEQYAVLNNTKVHVYNKDGTDLRVIEEKQKILSIHYILENYLATGGEGRVVNIYDIKTGNIVFSLKGFQNRIKAICSVPKAPLLPDDVAQDIKDNISELPYIFTISSDEYLRVWDLDYSTEKAIIQKPLRARPTSMTVSLISRVSDEEIDKLMDTHKQKQTQKLTAHIKTHSDESSGEEEDAEDGVKEEKKDEKAEEKKPMFRGRERVIVVEEKPPGQGKKKRKNKKKQQDNAAATATASSSSPVKPENQSSPKAKDANKPSASGQQKSPQQQQQQQKKRPRPNDNTKGQKPSKLAKHK